MEGRQTEEETRVEEAALQATSTVVEVAVAEAAEAVMVEVGALLPMVVGASVAGLRASRQSGSPELAGDAH